MEAAAARVEPDEDAGTPRCGDYVGAAVVVDVANDDPHDALRQAEPLRAMTVRGVNDEFGAAGTRFNAVPNAVAVQIRHDDLRGRDPGAANEHREDRSRRQNAAAENSHYAGL